MHTFYEAVSDYTDTHIQVKLHNEIEHPTHANRQLSESSTVCEKYAFLIEYTL